MAPLPESNTGRLYLDYEGPTGTHTMQFRYDADVEAAAAQAAVSQVIVPALLPLWNNQTNVTGYRFSAAGSDVTLPIGGAGGTGTAGVPVSGNVNTNMITFVGRTVLGRRWNLKMFETTIIPDTDYRLPQNQLPTTVVSAINALNSQYAGGGPLCGIDGAAVNLYNYVNTSFNAYQQRRRRRTA